MTGDAISDETIFAHFHDVRIDRDNIAHYRGLLAGQLLINRCGDCGYWIYPHRPLCPECLSWNVAATAVSGVGHLHMYTIIMQPREAGGDAFEPVVTAAVELAEQPGLRYLARIVDCPADALVHDMPLALTWIEDKGRRWPAFAPAKGEGAHG